ncbi:MAG: hypothetical protein R6V49_10450, partial [Bacteroidales bacterium]
PPAISGNKIKTLTINTNRVRKDPAIGFLQFVTGSANTPDARKYLLRRGFTAILKNAQRGKR